MASHMYSCGEGCKFVWIVPHDEAERIAGGPVKDVAFVCSCTVEID